MKTALDTGGPGFFRSLRVGLAAWRNNLLPAVVIWCFAFALVMAYYLLSPVRETFGAVGRWQRETGAFAVLLSRVLFSGVIPGVFLLTVRSIRPRRPFATIAAQTAFGCAFGLLCDAFFRLQCEWFGEGTAPLTLALKTLVDQFAWTVLVIAPANAVFFFWLGRDFSLVRTRAEWPRNFVTDLLMPNLVANWFVGIPAIVATYAFPVDLQIHVNGLISAFWMLMCLQIGRRSASS